MAQSAPASAVQPPATAFTPAPVHSGPLTSLQIADRILAKASAGAGASPIDRIVAGDPLTPVRGITTTAMATLECLKTSAALNRNLIVTHEPTFWASGDQLDRLEGDPLFVMKRDFIRAHGLVVLSLHDSWAAGIATGMARALRWDPLRESSVGTQVFLLPPTTLLGLARRVRDLLDDRTMRVVGNPALPVRHVAAIWGKATQLDSIKSLNSPVDVVICGYAREWEAVEYAQDMISAGANKGLVLLGELKAVEGGMRYCAEWLSGFVKEVPIGFVPVAEPYWNVRRPSTSAA